MVNLVTPLGMIASITGIGILEPTTSLFDQGVLRSTFTKSYGELNIEHFKQAYAAIEEGYINGKITLSVN